MLSLCKFCFFQKQVTGKIAYLEGNVNSLFITESLIALAELEQTFKCLFCPLNFKLLLLIVTGIALQKLLKVLYSLWKINSITLFGSIFLPQNQIQNMRHKPNSIFRLKFHETNFIFLVKPKATPNTLLAFNTKQYTTLKSCLFFIHRTCTIGIMGMANI